jgi:hypothetical protein
VLFVTSILILIPVALAPSDFQQDKLSWGGAITRVPSVLPSVFGAGIFTFRMIKKKDMNHALVYTCHPYGKLTALPSMFGFFGASLIMISLFVHYGFVDSPCTKVDYYPYEVCH